MFNFKLRKIIMQESLKNYNDSLSNAFKSWTEKPSFPENFGWDKVVAANKSNAKAFADVVQALSEGGQALARRQAEIVQKSAEEVTRFLREASSVKTHEAGIAKHADFAKASVDSALANSCELIEISSKLGNEARDIIGKRVSGAISEFAANCGSCASSEPTKENKRKSEAA